MNGFKLLIFLIFSGNLLILLLPENLICLIVLGYDFQISEDLRGMSGVLKKILSVQNKIVVSNLYIETILSVLNPNAWEADYLYWL